jgi:MFS family permease
MAESVVAERAPRVGWYYGWTIVGLTVLSQMMAVGVLINCFSLFLADWHRDFHTPVSTFQLAMTVFAVFGTPACAIAGWAVDRYSIRWVVTICLLGVAATQTAIGFSQSAWQVVALYALVGITVPMASGVPAGALVARWFVKRRGLALGISVFGNATAAMIFPPIVGAMMRALGWRETWWIFAAFIAFVAVPVLFLGLRDRPDPNDASGYLTGATHDDAPDAPRLTYWQILSRPNFWLIGAPFVFLFAIYMAVMANLSPLVRSHGMDAQAAVLLLSSFAAADLVGKLVCGAAADRFGNRAPFVALCAIGLLGAVGLALAPTHGLLIASLLCVGVVNGVWTLAPSATAVEFGQANFGRAFGLIMAFSPAGTLAPWVLARTQEWTGSYTPGLFGLGALILVAGALVMMLRERKLQPAG